MTEKKAIYTQMFSPGPLSLLTISKVIAKPLATFYLRKKTNALFQSLVFTPEED